MIDAYQTLAILQNPWSWRHTCTHSEPPSSLSCLETVICTHFWAFLLSQVAQISDMTVMREEVVKLLHLPPCTPLSFIHHISTSM